MIIQSKFKDYYDPLAHQYRDEKVVFERTNKELKGSALPIEISKVADKFKLFSSQIERTNDKTISRYIGVLFFCGKVYPFIETAILDLQNNTSTTKFNYTDFSFIDIIEKNTHQPFFWCQSKKALAKFLKSKYNGNGIEDNEARELNNKYGPIILCFFGLAEINPCLKGINFHLHPYIVIQELMAFLQSNHPKIPEPDNETKVVLKGFDKFSFRKEKGQGPKRKRKRG